MDMNTRIFHILAGIGAATVIITVALLIAEVVLS